MQERAYTADDHRALQGESGGGEGGKAFVAALRLDPGSATVTVAGELDVVNAPAVDGLLRRAQRHAPLVIVDLSALSFIDSAGLHATVTADARIRDAGGRLVVVQGPRQMRRIVELAGLHDRLDIVGTIPALPPSPFDIK
jgi:anti-sigma B factor antagonist